jgi:hypothetical protein
MNRSVLSVVLVAVMVVGCKNDDEGTGTDTQTGTAGGTSTSTASSGGGDTDAVTTTPTSGVLTSTDGGSSSGGAETGAPTTGGVVPCDSPEGCTGMGEGDLTSFTLPFFRGRVCVSNAVQPGDTVAISMSPCVHPCLTPGQFKYKYLYRCDGSGCELAIVGYHPGTTGTNCPADVFGQFPAELCEYGGPFAFTTGALLLGPDPFAGAGSLLVPFMTNADVQAIADGDNMSSSVWMRIESHMQDPGRVFEMSFAADNAMAPAACAEGVQGCDCRDIGF